MPRHIPLFVPLAAVLAALMAPPAAANSLFGTCSRALDPTPQYQVAVGNINLPGDGRSRTGSSTGRNVRIHDPIVTGNHSAVTGNTSGTRLQIRGMMGGTAEFLWRGESACVAGSMKPQFYSTLGRVYEHTQPLGNTIKACPHRWLAPKCSRTITIAGISYTANKGYPSCTGGFNLTADNDPANQQIDTSRDEGGNPIAAEHQNDDGYQVLDPSTVTPTPRATGVPTGTTLTIRIYGKLCTDQQSQHCRKFLPGGGTEGVGSNFSCTRANRHGYTATFAPGPNCGPPEWPTDQNRDAWNNGDDRFPPYARWCDFTVTVP